MQVYLPEAMYKQVKARSLPVSELLQKAVAEPAAKPSPVTRPRNV